MEMEHYYFDDGDGDGDGDGDQVYEVEEEEDDCSCGNFDCNICLDTVQDPVVTLCGHLFCWPCIYKWTCSRNISNSNQQDQDQDHINKHQKCPVCKAAGVSHTTLVPIYGRGGQTSKNTKKKKKKKTIPPDHQVRNINVIPTRPLGPLMYSPDFQSPCLEAEFGIGHHRMMNWTPDPVTSALCEMVYERLFGNSGQALYQVTEDNHMIRSRPHPMRGRVMAVANKSLSRIYFFLVCCMLLCLLLF